MNSDRPSFVDPANPFYPPATASAGGISRYNAGTGARAREGEDPRQHPATAGDRHGDQPPRASTPMAPNFGYSYGEPASSSAGGGAGGGGPTAVLFPPGEAGETVVGLSGYGDDRGGGGLERKMTEEGARQRRQRQRWWSDDALDTAGRTTTTGAVTANAATADTESGRRRGQATGGGPTPPDGEYPYGSARRREEGTYPLSELSRARAATARGEEGRPATSLAPKKGVFARGDDFILSPDRRISRFGATGLEEGLSWRGFGGNGSGRREEGGRVGRGSGGASSWGLGPRAVTREDLARLDDEIASLSKTVEQVWQQR